MSKSLKYFMCEDSKREEIVSIPGLERFKDEKGNVIPFEVRVLSQKRILDIMNNYKSKKIAVDSRKNPIVNGDHIVYEIEDDNTRAMRHIIVEALEYPKLDDPELMEYFNCYDLTEMPLLVFPKGDEFSYVSKMVFSVLNADSSGSGEVEAAKK